MAASTPSPEVLAYEKEHFYDSVVPQIMVGASISIAVTVGTTALRFIARKQRKAPLQSDDWLMLLAMVSLYRLLSFHYIGLPQHGGRCTDVAARL